MSILKNKIVKQLLVFKFEGIALLMRLIMLIIASPILWLIDVINFSIDVAKLVSKKKLVLKTALLIIAILIVIHLVENACGELNELYFELLKVAWLGFKVVSNSAIYLCVSTFSVFLIFLSMSVTKTKFFKIEANKISSGSYLLDEIFFTNKQRWCSIKK